MSQPQIIRFGIIGAGRIGAVHALSVTQLLGARLTHISDPFPAGAQKIAEETGARWSSDPAEIFADDTVDAVIVASPTATHIDLISAAIDAGKPVLCEKPIDLDISRVDALRHKAENASIPVAIGFNRRFDPSIALLAERAAAGDIGTLEQVTITSRDPAPAPIDYLTVSGGIFRDMTIHDFDTARFLIPNIVSVHATGSNVFSDEIREIGDFDSAVCVLRGSNGELVTIVNSRHAVFGYDQRIEAFGSTGMLDVGNLTRTSVRHYAQHGAEQRSAYENFFLERYADAYKLEIAEFIKAVRGEESTSPTFADGRAALVLANAADRSARTGEVVEVDLL